MADEPPDPNQLELAGDADEEVYFVPIDSWHRDAVVSAILTAGTLALVVPLGWVVDQWILARFLDPISLWTIRLILGLSFVVPMSAAILMDQVRFMLRTFRDLRAEWSSE